MTRFDPGFWFADHFKLNQLITSQRLMSEPASSTVLSSTSMKEGQRGCRPFAPHPQSPPSVSASLRTISLDDSEHLLHNHRVSVASLRLLFTFAPERRSASLRNQRSPSPEYPTSAVTRKLWTTILCRRTATANGLCWITPLGNNPLGLLTPIPCSLRNSGSRGHKNGTPTTRQTGLFPSRRLTARDGGIAAASSPDLRI